MVAAIIAAAAGNNLTYKDTMRFFLAVILLLGVSVLKAYASDADTYNERAKQLGLGKHSAWLALLHYKHEALSRRFISQVDGDDFFLSPEGKTNPEHELQLNIDAFLQPSARGHAQCLFPARWVWLKQQLNIASADYDVVCPKLESWLAKIAAEKLSLIFPAMYLNNPGSTFGHTFLRFDKKESALLSHALNYAAAIDPQDSGPMYLFKGLFGGYPGTFATQHYFEMVHTYSNIENRDIWEYQLDVTPDEINQLLRHVWELSNTEFDYFFFRENCSYRLLTLLDAVRPQANLTSGNAFPFYAIPVDTVRALDRAQLIKQRDYRPSLASQLRASFATLDPQQQKRVLRLVESETSVNDIVAELEQDTERAHLLETAYTLLQFRGEPSSPRANEILAARSELQVVDQPQRSRAVSPELGHASARIALATGEQQKQDYADLIFRPGFHDLLDAPLGYAEGAEVNVLDTQLRWWQDDEQLRLQRLRFFNIISLSPISTWYTPLSWQLDVALQRTLLSPNRSGLVFQSRGGAGYSKRWSTATAFAMAVAEVAGSSHYDKGYSLLTGVQLGASILFSRGQLLVLLETDDAFSGFERDKDSASIQMQLNLHTRAGLRLGYRSTRYTSGPLRFDDDDWFVRLQWYF